MTESLILENQTNSVTVTIFKVLNGGWANYKLYQCRFCEEIYVYELNHNPFSKEKIYCKNCNNLLNGNLIEYPTQIVLNKNIINTNVDMDVFKNIENSIVKDFFLLPHLPLL